MADAAGLVVQAAEADQCSREPESRRDVQSHLRAALRIAAEENGDAGGAD